MAGIDRIDLARLMPMLQELFTSNPIQQRRLLERHPELLSEDVGLYLKTMMMVAQESGDEEAAFLLGHILQGLEGFRGASNTLREASPSDDVDEPATLQAKIDRAVDKVRRYEEDGSLSYLDEALDDWEDVVQDPRFSRSEVTVRLNALNDIAVTHLARYRATGRIADLNAALRRLEQSIEATPENSLGLPDRLSNLGAVLSSRYDQIGDVSDLERAIDLYQRALVRTSESSPKRPIYLNSLGVALLKVYRRVGALRGLERCIEVLEEAEKATAKAPRSGVVADRSLIQMNLGNALRDRFWRNSDVSDLELACTHLESALEMMPVMAPNHPMVSTSLASALKDLYDETNDREHLERAIRLLEHTLGWADEGSEIYFRCLGGLGDALGARFGERGKASDLERAISLISKAVDVLPKDSPNRADYLFILGNSLRRRYEKNGDPSDYRRIQEVYRKASESEDCNVEFAQRSARNGADLAFLAGDWETAAEGYERSFELGRRLLKVNLARYQKELWLTEMQNLGDRCAYALAKCGELTRAVVALERSHVRLLDIALDEDRRGLRQLEASGHEALCQRLRQSAQRLSEASGQVRLGVDLGGDPRRLVDLRAADREVDCTLQEIRCLPGFECFLMPPDLDTIWRAAGAAPLVYLAVTAAGGLGLVVTAAEMVAPVWLPELSYDNVVKEIFGGEGDEIDVKQYLSAYLLGRRFSSDRALRQQWHDALDRAAQWLWRALMVPLLEALRPAAKVVVIPSGALCLLPLHVAWKEDLAAPTGRRYAFDDLVFSFVPSARSLVRASEVAGQALAESMLAVSDPRPTRAVPLPGAGIEARVALASFSEKSLLLEHESASRQALLAAMGNYSVLHFSCHAFADLMEPLMSGLIMANSETLSVADFLASKGKAHRLVVLSACETNMPGIRLPDEVVSLPTSLLGAGAAAVVGSLWSVADLSTAMLMARFYDLWRSVGKEAPEALRDAQVWLRDTTNGEKACYFAELRAGASRSTKAAVKAICDALRPLPGGMRSFAHPVHWAAFQYVGV